jgi:hypothetical protein
LNYVFSLKITNSIKIIIIFLFYCHGTGIRIIVPTNGSVCDKAFAVIVIYLIFETMQARLQKTRIGIGEDLVDGDFRYGFQANFMKDVVVPHWLNKFNWRKQEAILNKYPHFTTNIEGISVHFQQAKPKTGRKLTPQGMLDLKAYTIIKLSP